VSTESEVLLDRSAYYADQDVLVLADLHLGRDRTSAVELPVGERDDIHDRLKTLLETSRPAWVVLAGDVLHSFDRVPTGPSGTLDSITDLVETAGAELVVLKGNHDTMLQSLLDAPLETQYRLDEATVVTHGHVAPTTTAERYVIGHEHPAIRIEGQRYPCALDCHDQYEGTAVFVLPAFTRLARGTLVNDLDAAESVSPLLTDLDTCRPIVRLEDKPLRFPPLAEFRDLL
jgi:putative SbcD/Mre11-related phosphoesterase